MLSEKPRGGLSETRKMTKSTMEKKRRARINSSLTELKAILSGMLPNKGERFDKMEKADILEMTVKCVRQLQKQQTNTGDSVRSSSCQVDEDYRSGMHTCMSEVIKFISSSQFSDADPEVKTKLLNHLANKLNSGTAQKTNMNHEAPYAYNTDTSPGKNIHMSNLSMMDTDSLSISDLSNDSNNNFQTMNVNSSEILTKPYEQKSKSPTPMVHSPVLTSFKPIQPVQDNVQQQGNVPTVPLTILVPANFCSATLGTTCVIPFNLPTASPQQFCQGNIIQTVPQSPQTSFAVTSNSSISFIQAPSFIQSAHPQTKVVEHSNISPQNKVYTFNPTVVSECNRSSTHTHAASERPKSAATVSFTAALNSPERSATVPSTTTLISPERSGTGLFTTTLISPERSATGLFTTTPNSPERSTIQHATFTTEHTFTRTVCYRTVYDTQFPRTI
ncbi:protein hairy-like [Ruditapes philippinarum]|uniref:protein hairy-like n=1 Tax=Ruditapes philippinarum TaxID=129788 RepID=UPI00295BD3E3|nr:protein hairy-like [Ruditapes philippinarum]